MSSLKASFELNGTMTGQSDPVAIKISDFGFDVDNPSVTSGSKSITTGNKVIIPCAQGAGVDYYFYIRNTGQTGSMAGTGTLVIRDDHPSAARDLTLLEAGDFAFFVVTGHASDGGIDVVHGSGNPTNYVYAYFKRI